MDRKDKKESGLPDPRATPTLRVPEAAANLGVSRDTAYQAIKTGDLPVIRLCGALRVPTAALLKMLSLDAVEPHGDNIGTGHV